MPYHCDLASEWSKSGVALAAQREQSHRVGLWRPHRRRAHHRPYPLRWGDADSLVNRVMQAILPSAFCGAELLAYHGVGHTPRWEVSTRFADDVAAFVVR